MPHYYFDTQDGDEDFRDELGLDLEDDQAARDEAARGLAEMAKDYLPGSGLQRNMTIWVRDDRGETVLQVSCAFAVKALRGPHLGGPITGR